MPRLSLRIAAPAAAALLLAACGGDSKVTGPGGTPVNSGSFSGNVAGAVSRAVTGVAYFGQTAQNRPDEAGLVMAMGSVAADSSFKDVVVMARENRTLPAAGTYALHNINDDADPSADAFVLIAAVERPNAQSLLCFGTEGTLTVQSAAGGRMKGSYTSKAECVDPADMDADVAVTLSGSFDAVQRADLQSPVPGAAVARARMARAGGKR